MKILIMLSRIPYPLTKGDKLRAFFHIKELSKNHDIILCALTDEKINPEAFQELNKYCNKVYFFKLKWYKILFGIICSFFSGKPLQVGYFYDSSIKKSVKKIIEKEKPAHIFCQLIRVSEYVKSYPITKTLDYQDVFSKGVERRISTSNFFLKSLLKLEYRRLLKYEEAIFDYFDNKIIISEPDKNLIPHKNNKEIHVIPNGVSESFFEPIEAVKSYDLIFTGNMAYPPNINAAIFLAKEILPLIRKHFQDVKLIIVGASPSKKIKDLASDNIKITGWVKDMRAYYAQAKIFIAPMQIGTGLQNKLLEAMAMGLPCVTSKLANDALGAKDGKEILLGKDIEDYSNHVLNLLNDKALANQVGLNGQAFVKQNYNWEKLTEKISLLIYQ